jgi:hypothetical protein
VLDLPDSHLAIQAAPGRRPVLVGDFTLKGNASTRLSLGGLLLDGALRLQGPLHAVTLRHCSLVPDQGRHRPHGAGTDLNAEPVPLPERPAAQQPATRRRRRCATA